jgi:hypothetical protein
LTQRTSKKQARKGGTSSSFNELHAAISTSHINLNTVCAHCAVARWEALGFLVFALFVRSLDAFLDDAHHFLGLVFEASAPVISFVSNAAAPPNAKVANLMHLDVQDAANPLVIRRAAQHCLFDVTDGGSVLGGSLRIVDLQILW